MKNKIDIELSKLYKIKEMVDNLIDIPNAENLSIKELKDEYYRRNPDVFENLINAYNHINKYTDFNENLDGYDVLTESDISSYKLIKEILNDFNRSNASENRSNEGEKVTEENIYLYLSFRQFVGDDFISIKDIKQKWDRYSLEEQEKIKETARKKFDTRIWVLKDAVDEAIENTNKDKIEFEKNNKENSGEDIDI